MMIRMNNRNIRQLDPVRNQHDALVIMTRKTRMKFLLKIVRNKQKLFQNNEQHQPWSLEIEENRDEKYLYFKTNALRNL